ncbi:MAG: hypothetical protein CVU56_18270 [Deltaproteobacteria bacterium HGW-Deltaproteobacteria-14]|jgi:hypothetical protein|nr:MAG: hypothetical protein CVU56_18270 [Deltaproteobacteria bacterium HGW-Deltaproteobacteria-14]
MYARAIALVLASLLAACGDDGGSGSLQQDSAIGGPDGLAGDTSRDVASDDTAGGGDTVTPADSAAPDTAAGDTAGADTTASGPTLTIRVAGALEDRSSDDGLAGQTPSVWTYGLQRFELLRTPDDPNPAVIFDYAPDFVLVDMLSDNVVAEVPIAQLPAGSFPYFRIVLTHSEVVVAAALHQVPVVVDYSTDLDIIYALSDVKSGDLDMAQGDALVTADIFGTRYQVPTQWQVSAPSPAPNAWAEAVDGEWRVTFKANPALLPGSLANSDVTYGIRFYVTNAFRWRDQAGSGHAAEVWDIDLGPPAAFEPVERFGANAYEVYYQGP